MAKPLTIFLTTWNTGLQGSKAQSQDLTGWLLPVLQRTTDEGGLDGDTGPPDIYAIGVQELLPVNLAREYYFGLIKRDLGLWSLWLEVKGRNIMSTSGSGCISQESHALEACHNILTYRRDSPTLDTDRDSRLMLLMTYR